MLTAKFHEAMIAQYGDVIETVREANNIVTVDFKAGTAQATRDAINGQIATFNFNAPAANYKQFMIDCFNDGALTAATRRDISQMGLWFVEGQKQIALAIWALLSGGASAAAIRQHATDNNFTLP